MIYDIIFIINQICFCQHITVYAEGNDLDIEAEKLGDIELLIDLIHNKVPADEAVKYFNECAFSSNIHSVLLEDTCNFSLEDRMRIYSYTSRAVTGEMREQFVEKSFRCVREMVKAGTVDEDFYPVNPIIKKDKISIQLPLRVNWCGTWTDTPPFCLENGGAVVNAAVKINNKLPVKVIIEKIEEPKVVFEYFDSGYRGEFYNTDELTDCTNPLDPFLLLKSALIVCGIISMSGEKKVENMFEKIGGGISLSVGVVGIPKGSGLGTSSILLAACIKGILEFIGYNSTNAEIYRRVLLAEQLMGTGGGWQDQAGGLTNGIKLVFSEKGCRQEIKCEQLQIPKMFLHELNERFCLVYSGQRRLGRTILREIMGGYIQSDPIFVDTLKEMISLATDMRKNIELGNMENFIEGLNRQTKLTKRLDTGYINELLDKIFLACADMTAGKMICGAGGGGFIQFVIKEGYSKQDLSSRLKASFPHHGIDVWNCDFI